MTQIRRVQEILRRWDPLGVLPGEFAPADEYDEYAPHIVSLVAMGCSARALADHLSALRLEMVVLEAESNRDMDIAVEIIEALKASGP